MTRADSQTGLRYRNHERDGRSIMLFTRLRADDRAFWFLGPATYRCHVGEKPMAITQVRLTNPSSCIPNTPCHVILSSSRWRQGVAVGRRRT